MRWSALLLLFFTTGCQKGGFLTFNDQLASGVNRSPSSETIDYDSTLIIGSRSYVESVFIQVFNINSGSGDAQELKTGIYEQHSLGGACDLYGGSEIPSGASFVHEFPKAACLTANSNGITEDMKPGSNAMRYAITMKACHWAVSKTALFNEAMKKIFPNGSGQGSWPAPDSNTVTAAYQLFYPLDAPHPEVLDGIMELSEQGSGNLEKWQFVLLAICGSPEWQVLN
jgi:hypothetical protein